MSEDYLSLAQEVLAMARAHGADEADVRVGTGKSVTVTVRTGDVEKIVHNSTKNVAVRIFMGKRTGIARSSDFSPAALEQCVSDARDLAQVGDVDPAAGLADEVFSPPDAAQLQLYDPSLERITPDQLITLARKAEAAAFEYDTRITNSDGGSATYNTSLTTLVTSKGFAGSYRSGSASLAVTVMADDVEGKKRNASWWTANRRFNQLEDVETVGRTAAERAVRQLGARKAETREVPVVWDPMAASAFLWTLFSAVNGTNVYRHTSFLVGHEGEQIAAEGVNISDDATLPCLLGSRPFDGDGLPGRRTPIFENGIFKNFLFDTYTARRAGRQSTGSAASGGGITMSNLYMHPGEYTPEQIIGSVQDGLYLTTMLGFGENITTGDYSRGAAGIWIENGQLSYPVTEINISGRLQDMLKSIDMIGNDLDWRGNIAAPTFRMSTMVVSGT